MDHTSLLGQSDPNQKKNEIHGTSGVGPAGSREVQQPSRQPGGAATGRLWASIVILAIATAALAAWGYHELAGQRALFDGFDQSSALVAFESRLTSADQRILSLADRVATSDVVNALSTRLSGLESSLSQGLESTRGDIAEIRDSTENIDFRVQSLVESRTSPLREQLAKVEGAQQSHRAEILDLENQLIELRRATTSEIANLKQSEAVAGAFLEDRISAAERRLDNVAYAVDRDRIDFETYTAYDEELAPGVILHLNTVDRRYQRVDGWIWLVPEARFLRISDHPIQQALTFYTHQDERPHELVFTRVTETAAVGYLWVPSESFVQIANEDPTLESVAVAVID